MPMKPILPRRDEPRGDDECHPPQYVYHIHQFPVSLHDLSRMENALMSAVSDFAATVQANFDKIAAAVQKLDDLIMKLQSTQGQLTPEDQALLDQIQAASHAVVVSTEDGVPPVPTEQPRRP